MEKKMILNGIYLFHTGAEWEYAHLYGRIEDYHQDAIERVYKKNKHLAEIDEENIVAVSIDNSEEDLRRFLVWHEVHQGIRYALRWPERRKAERLKKYLEPRG